MALLTMATACARPPDPTQACRALLDAGEYDAALRQCEHAYAATGHPGVAVAVARAHFGLGNYQQVVSWHERLRGTSEERHGLELVASSETREGRLQEAEDAYARALALHRAAGDAASASRAIYGLFWIAWSSSRYRDALLRSHEGLEESRRADDPATTGRFAEGLFTILYDIGDLDGAAAALRIAEEQGPSLPSDTRARLLNNRGALLLEKDRLRLARSSFEQAVALVTDGAQSDFLRSLHLNLVEANVRLGEAERARRHLLAATRHAARGDQEDVSLLYWRGRLELESSEPKVARLTLRRALGHDVHPDWGWRLEFELGRAEELAGSRREAEYHYGRAADRVEQMRAELRFDEFKGWLIERRRQPLEARFRLQAERRGGARDALYTMERANARSFLDSLIASETAAGGDEPGIATLERVERLRALVPAFRESAVGALLPAETLLTALDRRHAVAYFVAEGQIWVVTLHRSRVTIRPLEVTADAATVLVDRFLAHPEDQAAATQLGDLLLPDEVLPANESTLHIVTDGPLARIPFAALRRRNRYVVEHHPIAYLPSLTALVAMERRSRSRVASGVALLGDPTGDLHQANAEMATLGARFRTRGLTGAAASKAALQGAASASLLHLATHAGQGPGGPWLVLSDGRVTAAQIVSERIGPRLVVLAACASATPRGHSIWGTLAAAFVAAGAEGVVASLWSIDDAATRELVVAFYDEGGAKRPALALARAQRRSIASNRPVSSWAPFVFVGSTIVESHTN
jgi:CHAT domain-containing protein/tetratricopeptide (TPR) repeat protein